MRMLCDEHVEKHSMDPTLIKFQASINNDKQKNQLLINKFWTWTTKWWCFKVTLQEWGATGHLRSHSFIVTAHSTVTQHHLFAHHPEHGMASAICHNVCNLQACHMGIPQAALSATSPHICHGSQATEPNNWTHNPAMDPSFVAWIWHLLHKIPAPM